MKVKRGCELKSVRAKLKRLSETSKEGKKVPVGSHMQHMEGWWPLIENRVQ